MYIKALVQAESKAKAETHLKNLLALADKQNLKLVINNIESYWKFDDSFQIEIDGTPPTNEQLSKFLESIGTKWMSFPNSYLITNTLEGCTIHLGNFEFIEVYPKGL